MTANLENSAVATPLRPLRGLQETRVATREESGVLGFPSRRGLTPQGSLEGNPDPIFPSGCEGKLGVALESLQHSALVAGSPVDANVG